MILVNYDQNYNEYILRISNVDSVIMKNVFVKHWSSVLINASYGNLYRVVHSPYYYISGKVLYSLAWNIIQQFSCLAFSNIGNKPFAILR